MQIRVQGQKIQCIRSTYDSEIKRSRQSVVATLPRWADKMPSDGFGIENLTDSELAELQAWLDAKRADREANDSAYGVRYAHNRIAEIADYVVSGKADDVLSADQAAKIWESIGKLQAAMKKAGHPRPVKPSASKQPKALPGQADLL